MWVEWSAVVARWLVLISKCRIREDSGRLCNMQSYLERGSCALRLEALFAGLYAAISFAECPLAPSEE